MMTNYSETFGRLLRAGISSIAACESKTAASVEEELSQQFGRAGSAIRRYKEGYLPPSVRIVELLTFACVQRGYLGREWTRRFLYAARYPTPDALLNQLFPAVQGREPVPRISSNLPPATYSQFVMRDQAFTAVLDGLCRRTAFVVIFGMGGTGKTSLAREVAVHCLSHEQSVPCFEAVVWVSDKDRPGTTNLSVVFDTIAQVLGFVGIQNYDYEEKHYKIDQVLRAQQVLLVIDNFETITDSALISWLTCSLPDPSKAVITTREYNHALRSGWPVELHGMREREAHELMAERLHVLGVAHLVHDQAQLTPLLQATGGNPKALTMAMGLLKHQHRPLRHVINDLTTARNELFADLFTHAWSVLNADARRVLRAILLFPGGAHAEALAATAAVHGLAYEQAIASLLDLSLLDVQQVALDGPPRYSLHPLVWAFVQHQCEHNLLDEPAACQRQAWYFVQQMQALPVEISHPAARIHLIAQEEQNLRTILEDALQRQDKPLIAALFSLLEEIWNLRIDPAITRECGLTLSIEGQPPTAECLRDVRIIETCTWMLIDQGHLEDASELLARNASYVGKFPGALIHFHYLFDLGYLHYTRGDYAQALEVWEQRLQLSRACADTQMYLDNLLFIAQAHYQMNQLDDAEAHLQELARHPVVNQARIFADVAYHLAQVALRRGQVVTAEMYLQTGLEHAQRFSYRRGFAQLQRCAAEIALQRGDALAAQAKLDEAMELFERLGLRRELREVRADMTRLAHMDRNVREVAYSSAV